MCRGQGDTQPCLSGGYGRRTYRADQQPGPPQLPCRIHRRRVGPYDERLDRRSGWQKPQPQTGSAIPEKHDVRSKPGTPELFGPGNGNGRRGSQCERRRHRGRIDIRARRLDKDLDQIGRSCHKCSEDTKRLSQRADERHTLAGHEPRSRERARPARAQYPERVRIINDKTKPCVASQSSEGGDGCDIAVHTEHPVCHDQAAAGPGYQPRPQAGFIAIAHPLRPRQCHRIDVGRMVAPVFENHCPAARQRRDNSEIRHIAGREQQCALGPNPLSKAPLERLVGIRVTAQQMRGGRTHTVGLRPFRPSRGKAWIASKPQIIIADKRDERLSTDPRVNTGRPFAALAASPGVPLAHVGEQGMQIKWIVVQRIGHHGLSSSIPVRLRPGNGCGQPKCVREQTNRKRQSHRRRYSPRRRSMRALHKPLTGTPMIIRKSRGASTAPFAANTPSMRPSRLILPLGLIAAVLCVPTAGASVGAAVGIGTFGAGLVLGIPVVPGVLGARLIADGGSLGHGFVAGGQAYEATAHLRNAALLADFYPFADPFHVSAGLYYNDNIVDVHAIADNGYYTFDGYAVPAAMVGPVTGRVTFARIAPYAGLGWGNLTRGRPGFVFGADVGVLWQRPHVTLSAPGAAGNPDLAAAMQMARDQVRHVADRFRLYPVAQVSFGYRF